MGLVNAVVPLAELERETVAWCREMTALSPLSLRLLKASFNAAEDGLTGLQQLSHDATLLFYMTEEGQEGRNAYQEGRRPTSRSSRDGPEPGTVSSLRIWLMAARPRTLPAAIAPVLVGTRGRRSDRPASCRRLGRLRRRADRQSIFIQIGTNLANDYSDAQARRRHGRPARARCGSPRPGWSRRGGCCVATWLAFGVAVVAGIYLATVAGLGDPRRRRRLDPRRRPLHRRPAALRLRRAGRAVRVPVLRPGRRQRLLLRAARASSTGCRSGSRSRSACSSTAILVVNNVRDLDTDRRAGKRTLAVRLGRERTRRLYAAARRSAPSSRCRSALVAGGGPPGPLIGWLSALPLRVGPLRAVLTRTDGPALNGALAGTGALLGAFSLLVSVGLLIAS